LYAACYQRFDPLSELKSTPAYDYIRLSEDLRRNFREFLFWAVDLEHCGR